MHDAGREKVMGPRERERDRERERGRERESTGVGVFYQVNLSTHGIFMLEAHTVRTPLMKSSVPPSSLLPIPR